MRRTLDGPTPAFTGATLDRAALLRHNHAEVEQLLRSEGAAVLLADGDGTVLIDTDRLARRPLTDAHAAELTRAAGPILLGLEGERPLFALDISPLGDDDRASLLGGTEPASLRDAGAQLAQAEGGLAAYLVALLGWHRRHGFCAACGGPTEIEDGGLARRCQACGELHFPRMDPVVIMLVEHDDRLLLGRRAGWPEARYSVLAGFVAPGETLEEAVIREVAEESGVVAHAPRYVASQPWPFPASLMLGFEARSDGGEPAVGDGELEHVAWFERSEILAAVRDEDGPLKLPPPISIARTLIDGWIARGGTQAAAG